MIQGELQGDPHSRGQLLSETAHQRSVDLDRLPIAEALARMQACDREIHAALEAARQDIARAVELAVTCLKRGGRVFYVGAGTSGRLGALDAAELPPTFGCDPQLFQGVIAGGERALRQAIEGVEDDPHAAERDLAGRKLGPLDLVFGIAASGTTPYVHGALEYAARCKAHTVFLACVPREQAADRADVSIRVPTGPEFLTGSTRLKAGTATKLVLNAFSTLTMAQMGKVYSHWMVDLAAGANRKLTDRAERILCAITKLERSRAKAVLGEAGGELKVAVLMQALRLSPAAARALLAMHHGHLRAALEGGQPAP